ncbi:MAG: hypothetical protein K2X38_10090 [Gemmataceae bacterium]|nr:hypothetical protein [Gemmataceae bacterium]
MTSTIPVLWPEDIKVDVQTPLSILRVQAENLGRLTRGVLQGEVESEEGDVYFQHRLVVVAPAYGGYRHTILVALHKFHMPYPCEVRSESLSYEGEIGIGFPSAVSEEQLIRLVRKALTSDETKAAMSSLIANSISQQSKQ